jgi:hypothetical protein
MRLVLVVGLVTALGGCASIVEGTSQNIVVNTSPSGADCGFYRRGLRIATVMNAPGSGLVSKTKYDIWIVCVKKGYQEATYFNHSGIAGGTFGNIVLGGGIGWAIDSASGADNKYDSPVNMSLVPEVPGAVTAAATLPSTFDGPSSLGSDPQKAPPE